MEPSPLDARGITVTIKRERADDLDAYTWVRWHTSAWPILALFLLVVVVITVWTRAEAWWAPSGVIFLPLLYFLSLRRVAMAMERAHLPNGVTTYTIAESGVECTNDVARSQTQWTAFIKAAETKRSFLLFMRNSAFIILPKRCFAAADVPRLRLILERGVARDSTFRRATQT